MADKELIIGVGAVLSALAIVLLFKYVFEAPQIFALFTVIMILIAIISIRSKSSD